ncbi:MAG TPA: hypothetical protein VFY44_11720 [Thermoleophilaceae bacterium]|nr:hypothetical protein [Thermoleophilaceae bacterium]
MKRCLIIVVALLALSANAWAASAAAPALKTGTWKGQSNQSDSVRFTVKKDGGDYVAGSTRVSTVVGCDAPNPRDSTYSEEIKRSRITVKLSASGDTLRGSRTVTRKTGGGKTTETVKVAMKFTSARRAKVVVNASANTKGKNVNPNAAKCGGRVELTAKPQ